MSTSLGLSLTSCRLCATRMGLGGLNPPKPRFWGAAALSSCSCKHPSLTTLQITPYKSFANHLISLKSGTWGPGPHTEARAKISAGLGHSHPQPLIHPRHHCRHTRTQTNIHGTYFCSIHLQIEIPVPWQLEGHFRSGRSGFFPQGEFA